jgi:hypothetical protein
MTSRSVVFAEPVRTAIGTFGGSLKDVPAPTCRIHFLAGLHDIAHDHGFHLVLAKSGARDGAIDSTAPSG